MKIFIDCGFYYGTMLDKYIRMGIIDDSWTVYGFEPNRDLNVPQYLKDHPFPMKVNLIKKAIWDKDGRTKFHIAGREDAASVKGTTGHVTPKEISVQTIDFSKFVQELPDDAYIFCSMNVEGSEYRVLEKMFADGSIDKIDFFDIEFHHRFMDGYTQEDSQEIIDKLLAKGIAVRLMIPLS